MSSVEMAAPHPELHRLQKQLRDMLQSMSTFAPALPKPPIIDSSLDLTGNSAEDAQHRESVRGMRALKDTVKRDLDVLEKVFLMFFHRSIGVFMQKTVQ